MKLRYENLVTAIFCLLTVNFAQAAEPTYKGQPLSEWLVVLTLQSGGHYLSIPPGMEQPEVAIRQIGAKGIPTLLDMLGAKTGNKRKVIANLKSPRIKEEFSDPNADLSDLRSLAVDGFGILGTNAQSAVPQIKKLIYDPETCFDATRALSVVGPTGLSALTNALADPDDSIRNSVIWVLGEMRSGDSNAITRLLVKALKDPDAVNRGNAATFLGGRDPDIAIPALIAMLDENHTNFVTVTGAAKGLSSYGSAAKAAAPILVNIYTNEAVGEDVVSARNWGVELMQALRLIDMDAAAKAEELLVNSGPLNNTRSAYTKTLLPNGKELIAGGLIHTEIPKIVNRTIASAELIDPATGKWTETGEMNLARCYHMATLLQDGKVLVVGGVDDKGHNVTSAELYDPATEKWTETGSMNNPHPSERMALQSNGKVLVYLGGWAPGVPIIGSELYDPASGIWTVITNK